MRWFLTGWGMVVLAGLLLIGLGTGLAVTGELSDVLVQNVHTHAVQQSQGYIEAANQACSEDHQQFEQATTEGQVGLERASLDDCRSHLVGISTDEIRPDVRAWLQANGGV